MKKFFALYVLAVASMAVGLSTAKAGTIAHWTFENDGPIGSSPTTILDSVGGNNGTTFGSPTIVSANSGFGNKGLLLDGSSKTVQVDANGAGPLALTGDFTIEIGFRGITNGGFGVFFGGPVGGRDPYYVTLGGDGSVNFQLYPGVGGYNLGTGSGAFTPDEHGHNVAAVFDVDHMGGGTNLMSIFVDGILQASLDIGTDIPVYDDPVADFWIGSVHNSFGFMDGIITDVRISDMALTGENMIPVPEPGMLALFGAALVGLGLVRRKRG